MKKLARILIPLLFWGLVWQLAYMLVGRGILLASPAQTARRLIELAQEPSFWKSAGFSVYRVFLGCILGVAGGVLTAALTAAFAPARIILEPALTVIRATPVASFVLLALIFLSSGPVPVLMSFLMVLPIVWGNVDSGLRAADRGLLEMSDVFKLSLRKKISSIYIPAALPNFFSACATSIGLGWKAGIAAEVLGTPKFSIGTNIYNAKIYLETPDLFAWTAVVIILSLVFEKLLSGAVSGFAKRRDGV